MRVWRISDFADLRGNGGLYASGRWHTRGHPIVYFADHPASALLEVLVRLEVDVDDLPDSYQLLEVEIADDIATRAETIGDQLPEDWNISPAITRKIGDDWLTLGRDALLRVPSAIVPSATNWLLNPQHPDAARMSVANAIRTPFDPRLLRHTAG